MSRQQRKQIRVEKLTEIVDFRFLQFHATKVPNGWDKLAVTVISVETGKAIARTNKAVVQSGNCKWLEDVSESVRFLQDDNSRELEEKLYKFVVSMGSARLGILGEATVNLADYLNSKEIVWIKLPLKKCDYGTILHVKIQCLTPRSGSRESERWSKSVKDQVERIAVFNEADDGSEGSIRSTRSSFHGRSNISFLQTEDADYLAENSRHGLDSLELSVADSLINGNSKAFAYGDQASPIKNGFHRRQHSTGPRDGIEEYRTGNGIDQYGARLFGGKDSGTLEYPRNRSFDKATSGNGSSNEFLEAAEVSIQELQKESMMWERKAQNFILETKTLKQQLAEQQQQHKEMEMQFLTMQTERDSFKQEVEQLESVLQNYIENEKGADNAKFEAQEAKRMVKEFEDEIKLQKESNANLSLQLSKIQEANTELVFALQDLEETVQQQNVEIVKLLEARERNQMDISEQEAEEMRQSAESIIKFSDVVAERDNLKKEVEKLRSDTEHRIYNVQTKESDVKHDVQELQEDMKHKELSTKLSLKVQNAHVLNREFSPIVDKTDEVLIDKDNETHENLSTANKMFEACAPGQRQFNKNMYDIEAERMQKLSYQKEEIRTLKNKISSFSSVHSLTEVTEYIDESQQDLHQDLESLKRDMNELEKDCKELADENLELIHSLNKVNKNLESKNVYIAELEEKLRVSSFGSTLLGEHYIGIQTGNAASEIDELKAQVNDLEKKTDSSKPLYNAELVSIEMLLHDSQRQVMKAQTDNSSLQKTLNTFEERIHELEIELKNAYEQTSKTEKMLTASHEQQLDACDSRAYKAEQELAGAIQKVQTLKIKNINDTIFIDELEVMATQLNEKVETSEHLHSTELANMKRSLNEYQSQVLQLERQKLELECNYQCQVLELESQKLEMECLLNIFKKRVCDLERGVITTQQETSEREVDLTVNFESRLQDDEARVAQAEDEVVNALQLVQTLEEDKSTLSIQCKGLNDHLTDLEQKLNSTTDSYTTEFANKEKLLGDFQHQVINLQNQNHGLEGELSVLKGRIHDLESEVQTAEQEIVKREEDVKAAYEYKLESTTARAIRAEVDLAHSHEIVKSHESSTSKDAVMLDGLKLKVIQLQKELKSLEDLHNMKIAGQEKSFSNFRNQEMKLRSENAILENKISMLNEKICELENEARKSQQEATDREKEIAHKEKLLSDFQQQVMNVQNQNHGLQGELNVLKERNCDLESAVQTAEREMVKREEKVTASYEYKLQIIEARALGAETDLADSLKRVESFKSSTAKDAIMIDDLNMQTIQLKQELKSFEDVHSTQLTGLEKSLSDFRNQVQRLQSENAIIENNASMLKEKICDLQNEAQKEAMEREQEITNKEKLLSDVQHRVIDLQNQNHGLQGELNVFKERIYDLESEVQKAEGEIVKREKEVTAAYEYKLQITDARAIRAEANLADILKRVNNFESSAAKDAIMIHGLKAQVIQLQKELKSSEDVHSMQLAGLEKSVSDFQNQLMKLRSENNTLECKVSIMNEKNFEIENEAQQEAIEREEEIANKEKLLNDFQHQVKDLYNQNHGLQGELNVLKERIGDLESEAQKAERERVKREEEVTTTNEYNLQRTEGRAIRAEVDLVDSLERIKSFECSIAKDAIMIDGLRVQIIQLQQELKSSEDAHSMQLAGMEKSLYEFQNHVKNLKSENTVLEKTICTLKEKNFELKNEGQKAQQETADMEKDLSAAYESRLQANEARAKAAEEELANVLKSVVESDNAKHKMGEIISEQQKQVKAVEDQTVKIQDELMDALKTIRNLEVDKERISIELSNECTKRQNAENAISSLDQLDEQLRTKIQNLETKHLENSLQLRQLEETNLQQQKQLDGYSLIEKSLQENINHLEIVKMQLHSEIDNLQEERSSKSSIQDLNCQLSALMMELQSLKYSDQNLDDRATKLQMENVDLEEKLDAAQKEIKSAGDHQEDLGKLLEPLRANAESTSLVKTSLEKRAMQLQHSKEETESRLKETLEKYAHLVKQVYSLEMQLNNTVEEHDFFRLDLEKAKASCFNLQVEMKTLALEFREENVKLLEAFHESQKKLSGTLEEVDSCKMEQKLLELTLENLKKEHTAAMDLNSELEKKCFNSFESRTNVEQRLQKITGNIFVSFNQIKSLESDLSILQQNMTGKKGIWAPNTEVYELATREYEEKGIKSDEAISQEYSENENAVESLQMKVQSLSRQVYSVLEEKERILTEALLEASDLRAAIMKLEDSLQLNMANTKQSEADFLCVKQEHEREVQELKLEVENGRKREEDLHLDLAHVHRQLEDTNVREVDLQKRVQEIKIQVATIENEKQKLKDENISLSRQVDQLMGLKDETDGLQSIVEHARDEKNTLQQSLHSTEAEIGCLKAENVFSMEKLAATNQGLVEVDELTQRNAELEEKILFLQAELNAKEVEHKNKSVQLQRLSDQFQWKLQNLEELKENYLSKENLLENELQFKVLAVSKAEVLYPDKTVCEVGCTSPPQDTNQSTKLSDRVRILESELETHIKEFEEKEETLIAEIQKLEEMNHQLMQAKLDSDTDQLQIELIRLQKQNSTLLQKQYELLSKLGAHELLQKEVSRLHEVNKQLKTQLARFRETAKRDNILERVVAMETELAEALEVNSMYQLQLQSFLHQEPNVHLAALHGFGPIDQIISDLVSYKRKISTLEAELNDLRERYSSLSLKLAEVEVQREELVMTIKHAKYGKRWYEKR